MGSDNRKSFKHLGTWAKVGNYANFIKQTFGKRGINKTDMLLLRKFLNI